MMDRTKDAAWLQDKLQAEHPLLTWEVSWESESDVFTITAGILVTSVGKKLYGNAMLDGELIEVDGFDVIEYFAPMVVQSIGWALLGKGPAV